MCLHLTYYVSDLVSYFLSVWRGDQSSLWVGILSGGLAAASPGLTQCPVVTPGKEIDGEGRVRGELWEGTGHS